MIQGSKKLVIGTAVLWIAVAIIFMPMRLLLALPGAALSFLVLARLLAKINNQKYDRLANQKCVNCGYDLRESKDRCPECGAAFGLGWGGMVEE